MKHLFVFAHPDDEAIAAAGTIRKLIDAGEEVIIVSVTDGSAGEVIPRAQEKLHQLGSVKAVRRDEMKKVAALYNVQKLHILEFQDGHITNKQVWGELKLAIIKLIEEYKPEVVVTFDHTGWYFHLDHVGVSIATTWAVQQAKHKVDLFFLSHFWVEEQKKWKYFYNENRPITHVVDISAVVDFKLKIFNAHYSQDLEGPSKDLREKKRTQEFFELATATKKGQDYLKKQTIFQPLHQK